MPRITKSDGGVEQFDASKLTRSLRSAGADEAAAAGIARDIEKEISEGMSTHDVYARAFALLREHRRSAAARYSLKRAILEFGPSGFPFESYLAELYRAQGYEAEVDAHIRGACVEHEIDVVLHQHRGGVHERIYVEAKFHNTLGFKTDLQVALYVQARLEDILAGERGPHDHDAAARHHGMVITNTKFTSLAVAYARCKGLGLVAWEYPAEGNLHDKITAAGLYPITALTTLSHRQKQQLLGERVVLCNALSRHEEALAKAGVGSAQMRNVLEEASGICAPQNGR